LKHVSISTFSEKLRNANTHRAVRWRHMKNKTQPPPKTVRANAIIIMSYKEQCKTEGTILARIKLIRTVLSGTSQKDVARLCGANKNTVSAVMRLYHTLPTEQKELLKNGTSFTKETVAHFTGLAQKSRAPHGHSRSLSETEETVILDIHKGMSIGPNRMYTHLMRQGKDKTVYTLAKIKGCYKRHGLSTKKVRTANRERRPLYNYEQLASFEHLHFDTKHILDKHALPQEIYDRFKDTPELPIYQWTLQDAKTRMRFLAYSHELSSFYGQRFLLFAILWLRAHGIHTHITTMMDGGSEFCRASEKKLKSWNNFFTPYGATVLQTNGDKVKQNIVERSHRTDDEEFYCPRGSYIHTKTDFLLEAQRWNIYFNVERPHGGIDHMTPSEKLRDCGYGQTTAEAIGRFPTFILEDVHKELVELPQVMAQEPKREEVSYPQKKSQNVFAYYP
jgi:putative transposase